MEEIGTENGERDKLITETGVSFRDRVSNIDKTGRRIWIYPKKPNGPFHRARAIVACVLLAAFFALPFIKLHGEPLLLLDILNRRFIIFGIVFWPQDMYIFALSFLTIVVFIVLFTAVYGRLWCGWACPQTIFMEMVFRKIEYLIEGDARKQKELSEMPMNGQKFIKRALKHGVFFIMSFIIGNFMLAYIIGMDQLLHIISDPVSNHIGGFVAMILFSGAFYFIFAWFREQACTYVCPYGRLQSVLLDKNTIVVAYDNVRGEPRGRISKSVGESKSGDCIDCGLCVQVCPTGIDIRNGTQLECVNCTACIDACDEVMAKVKKPKKLIKYASFNQIMSNQKFRFTPRIILYTIALVFLLGLTGFLVAGRSDIDATILRAQGVIYQELPNGKISNLYNVKIINKTFKNRNITLKIDNIPGKVNMIGMKSIGIKASSIAEATFFVEIGRDLLKPFKNEIVVGFYEDGKELSRKKILFNGPKPSFMNK